MPSRRFSGSAGSAAAVAGAAAAPAPERWNLLLLTNDQHRADVLGCAGNPVVRTPILDRLASEGVVFERHFVQCPQCVPSGAALHTGRYPHVNRTPTNRHQLPPEEQALPALAPARRVDGQQTPRAEQRAGLEGRLRPARHDGARS